MFKYSLTRLPFNRRQTICEYVYLFMLARHFCYCDLDADSITLIDELDLYILKIYQRTKKEVSRPQFLRDRARTRHIDRQMTHSHSRPNALPRRNSPVLTIMIVKRHVQSERKLCQLVRKCHQRYFLYFSCIRYLDYLNKLNIGLHLTITNYQLPGVERWLIMYWVASACLSVCLCVINFCKQSILTTNSWIVAKFLPDTPCILVWKLLTFGADHIQDG